MAENENIPSRENLKSEQIILDENFEEAEEIPVRLLDEMSSASNEEYLEAAEAGMDDVSQDVEKAQMTDSFQQLPEKIASAAEAWEQEEMDEEHFEELEEVLNEIEKEIVLEIPNIEDFVQSMSEIDFDETRRTAEKEPSEHQQSPFEATELDIRSQDDEFCLEEFEFDLGKEEESVESADTEYRRIRKSLERSESGLLLEFFQENIGEPKKRAKGTMENAQDVEEEDTEDMQVVGELLEDILKKVVERGELVDPNDLLRKQLDRGKLLTAINETMEELDVEKQHNSYLNEKVAECFWKKRIIRALIPDIPRALAAQKQRYITSLLKYDLIAARLHALELQRESKIGAESKILFQLEGEADRKHAVLNELLRKAGLAAVSIKTGKRLRPETVEKLLRRMIKFRNEISATRLTYIKAQHEVAVMKEQLLKFDDFGNGFRMMDYEQLRAETENLRHKIDERQREIGRLQRKCNEDMHKVAHIRERRSMLQSVAKDHGTKLNSLKAEIRTKREELNRLNLELDADRKKYNKLLFDSGLLHKSSLMRDYDTTKQNIKLAQTTLDGLMEANATLEEKIRAAERELKK